MFTLKSPLCRIKKMATRFCIAIAFSVLANRQSFADKVIVPVEEGTHHLGDSPGNEGTVFEKAFTIYSPMSNMKLEFDFVLPYGPNFDYPPKVYLNDTFVGSLKPHFPAMDTGSWQINGDGSHDCNSGFHVSIPAQDLLRVGANQFRIQNGVWADDYWFSGVKISGDLRSGVKTSATQAEILLGPITNPANGNKYYLLEQASWTESQAEAMALGGNLVTINDRAEDAWVYKLFSRFGGRSRNLWIGLNDVKTEGSMLWVSGEPADYTNWVPGEPNDSVGHENYGMIWGPHRNFAYGGRWNDLRNSGGKYRVHGVVEIADEGNSGQEDQSITTNNETVATIARRLVQLEKRVARLESSTTANNATGRPRTADNPFVGEWVTLETDNRGITRVSIRESSKGQPSIRAWGACQPTDCDWGATELHLLANDVTSKNFSSGFATWDHAFTDVYFTLRIERDELVIESYDVFKDSSGRSNYRRVERFRRETSPTKAGREDVPTAAIGWLQNRVTTTAPTPKSEIVLPSDEVASKVRPLRSANSHPGDNSLAVYFTFGPVNGARTLVQANWDGTVRSHIELPYSVSGLTADDGRLLATVGSSRVGTGRVIAIGNSGEVTTVFRDAKMLPDTCKIWSTAGTDEFIVADNGADQVVAVSKHESPTAEVRIRLTDRPNYQSMSVAKCKDGSLIFSDSDENGVFRIPPGSGSILGEPLLDDRAAVAARPGSNTWVAALREQLHVFEGDRPVTVLTYPEGMTMFRPNIDFAVDGTLVLAFHSSNRQYFYAVDLDTKQFAGLFTVDVNRLTSLAIAQKMKWAIGGAVNFESAD